MSLSPVLCFATLKGLSDGSEVYFVSLSVASASPRTTSLVFQRHRVLLLDGNLLNDKPRDWSKVAIGLLECCRTPRVLQISPTTAINDPEFWKGIAIRTLMFSEFSQSSKISVLFMSTSNCCESSLDLLVSCFWLISLRNCSLCRCSSNISISFVTLFCCRASCSFTVEIDIPGIPLSAVLLRVSP